MAGTNAEQPGALIAMKNTSGLCISRTATRLTRLGKIMTKTLADMTPEERAECVGMWALIEGISLAVIAEADETNTCVVTYPQWDGDSAVHLNGMVTPRFDLPRVWTPDGEPELAQALAEETYFYGVQVWMGGRWIMMLTSDYGTSLMHRGKWFEHKHEAEECAAKWNHDTPTRIVRQRRSPVEVISD